MIVKDALMHKNIAKKYKLVIAVEQLILIKYKVGITMLQTYVWFFFISMKELFDQIFIFLCIQYTLSYVEHLVAITSCLSTFSVMAVLRYMWLLFNTDNDFVITQLGISAFHYYSSTEVVRLTVVLIQLLLNSLTLIWWFHLPVLTECHTQH